MGCRFEFEFLAESFAVELPAEPGLFWDSSELVGTEKHDDDAAVPFPDGAGDAVMLASNSRKLDEAR